MLLLTSAGITGLFGSERSLYTPRKRNVKTHSPLTVCVNVMDACCVMYFTVYVCSTSVVLREFDFSLVSACVNVSAHKNACAWALTVEARGICPLFGGPVPQ